MYELPSGVHCEFCRVMDTLPDLDWTRFGESPPAGSDARRRGVRLWVRIKPLHWNKTSEISTSVIFTWWNSAQI